MYRRFLNNGDYLGIITKDALSQITRNDNDKFGKAEEAAEASIVDYLSDKYEGTDSFKASKIMLGKAGVAYRKVKANIDKLELSFRDEDV